MKVTTVFEVPESWRCPHCDRSVVVKRNGELWKHRTRPGRTSPFCVGSSWLVPTWYPLQVATPTIRAEAANDVARRWTACAFTDLELPTSLAEALDRLAVAYGFLPVLDVDE